MCITLFCAFLCGFCTTKDRVEMTNFAFYGVSKQATTKFHSTFGTWIRSLGIQLQKGSPTFDTVSGWE